MAIDLTGKASILLSKGTAHIKRLRTLSSAIAKQFVCSISQELMVDPVIAEDGNTY